MKTFQSSGLFIQSAVLAGVLSLTLSSSNAKIGGIYRGTAAKNKISSTSPSPPPPLKFGKTKIMLRLPNGTGGLSGKLFTSKPPLSAPTNIPIKGRVTKSASRQGGNKHIIAGKWTWNFKKATGTKATGPFRIIIKKTGNKYKFAPVEKVKVKGGPPAYFYTSKVSATK